MKQYVDKYHVFLEEAKEKFKPSDYEEKQLLMQDWSNLNESVRKELNKWIKEYDSKLNSALKDYAEQDVELTIEKLSPVAAVKILKANNWQPSKLDEISIIL
jgi:hypothetical protein